MDASLPLLSSPEKRDTIPLIQYLPYFVRGAKTVYSISSRTLGLAAHLILKLFFTISPVPILRYILAPVWAVFQHLWIFFVLSPYRIALHILEAIYPFYLFFGVAMISGLLLGLAGRFLVKLMLVMVLKPIVVGEKVEEKFKPIYRTDAGVQANRVEGGSKLGSSKPTISPKGKSKMKADPMGVEDDDKMAVDTRGRKSSGRRTLHAGAKHEYSVELRH